MDRDERKEPFRRTLSANSTYPQALQESPVIRKSVPLLAPTLMLINGSGETSSLPSPVVGKTSDDDSLSSDTETPIQEHNNYMKSLTVPSIFDSPVKSNANRAREYSASLPPKRPISPPKMAAATSESKPLPNHRRGHRHKHSLSHQIFLPPPERPPLPLPSHLPTPTIGEVLVHGNLMLQSILSLVVHVISIIYLIYTSTGESSLVALSFLALRDLLASCVELVSQILIGFDVWRTATLRFPFGLQRIESLAEFALGVFSTFNGLYVLKETIEDIIISFGAKNINVEGSSGGHHHHHHYVEANPQRVSPGGVDVPVLLIFLSTVYLILTMSPHAKTSRLIGLRVDSLTLISCVVIFLVPLLGLPAMHIIDRGIALVIAFCMIVIGLHTGKVWGSILLCIPSKDERILIKQISSATGVVEVGKHRMFQATHRSGIAMFTIHIAGGEDIEIAVREHIGRCITDWDKKVKWECFVEFER